MAHMYASHGARCFVTTLRDPAERLMTAFAWEASHPSSAHMKHLFLPTRGVRRPGDFVDALLNLTHPMHDIYAAAINGSVPGQVRWKRSKLLNGNTFLMPQVGYIAGEMLSADVQLGIVCTNRFGATWKAFLSPFEDELRAAGASKLLNQSLHLNHNRARASNRVGLGSSHGSARHGHDHVHGDVTSSKSSADETAVRGGYRSEAQRQWVRECLFPEDYALWKRLCNNTPG